MRVSTVLKKLCKNTKNLWYKQKKVQKVSLINTFLLISQRKYKNHINKKTKK